MTRIPESTPKVRKDWADVNRDAADLVAQIREYSETTGHQFTGVLVMPKGGYHNGSLVPEGLGFDNDQILHACIQSYDPTNQSHTGKYIVGEMPPQRLVQGEDLLLLDEVWDTGVSMFMAKGYCRILGAASVMSAVNDFKDEKNTIDDKPDFYVNVINAWIEYPWEREREPMREGRKVAVRSREPTIVEPREWLAELAVKYAYSG